jgi:hypothetical protein
MSQWINFYDGEWDPAKDRKKFDYAGILQVAAGSVLL